MGEVRRRRGWELAGFPDIPALGTRVCIQLARKMLKMEGMQVSQTAFPASFGQQRLWFLDQLEPGTAAYNMARAFRITGPLDTRVLTRAFESIVRRHESLRTVFDSVDGEARQIVLSDVEVQIPVVDLTDIPRHDREKQGLRIASEEGIAGGYFGFFLGAVSAHR